MPPQPDWMDPNQQATYATTARGRSAGHTLRVRLPYITGGTRPISGYGGPESYQDLQTTTPSHTYQQVTLPGFRMGAGGQRVQQPYTYNLPFAQPPGEVSTQNIASRSQGILHQQYRRDYKLAIPGATEGEFAQYMPTVDPETGETTYGEREDWRTVSEEQLEGWLGGYAGKEGSRVPRLTAEAKQQALEEQASVEQAHAKWWNETRYSQLQQMMGEHFRNQMATMEGMGEQERSDILRQGGAMQDRAMSQAMQRGMAGTTALSAMQRGAQAQTSQDLGQFYSRQQQARLGVQQQLASQYMGIVEGRTDEYPSTYELAQMMYGTFGAGAGSEPPEQGGGMGMGMAGIGIGAGLGMAAASSGAAAGGAAAGGLGCLCQIFMEGRHGDGTMDWVVRTYRDEHINERNARGYYKMSEVIVPLMRKSKLLKLFFFLFFIQPCFLWGRWHYRDEIKKRGEKLGFAGRCGWMFGPIKRFWERTCYYLGQDHPYIRWNGELV